MGKPFSVNINRFDPYKAYRFLVYFGTSTTPVAGVSKVSSLKRSSDVIEYKQGGNAIILKGLGRTKYEPITLERGVTYDTDFQDWADATQALDNGAATTSLKNLRKEIRIELRQRGGAVGLPVQGPSLLGVGVPGPARPRRRRDGDRPGAHQARERGLGAGRVPDRTARDLMRSVGRIDRSRGAAVGTRSDVETELGRFRLPVSGREVALRHPGGAEDLLLLEAARTPGGDAALALALASRLTRAVEGEPIDWGTLSVTDLDALVLRLRQALIGDRIRADVACPAPGCRRRIDIDFRIAEFLAHRTPARHRTRDRGWVARAGRGARVVLPGPGPRGPRLVERRSPPSPGRSASACRRPRISSRWPAAPPRRRSWPAAASGRPRSPRGSVDGSRPPWTRWLPASPATCRGPAPSAGPRSPCSSMPDGSACASCATGPRSSTRTLTSWPGATTGPRRRSCRCRRSGEPRMPIWPAKVREPRPCRDRPTCSGLQAATASPGMLAPPRVVFRPPASPMEATTARGTEAVLVRETGVDAMDPAEARAVEGEVAPTPAPPRPGPGPHTARAGPPPPRALDPIDPDVGEPPLRPAAAPGPVAAASPLAPRPGRADGAAVAGPEPRASGPDGPRDVERPGPRSARSGARARQPPAEPPGPRVRPADEDAGDDLRPAAFAPADRPRAALTPGPPAMAPGPVTAEPRAAGPRSRPVAAALEAATGPPADIEDRPQGSASTLGSTIRLEPPAVAPRPQRTAGGESAVGVRIGSLEVRITPPAAGQDAASRPPGAPARPARPAPQPLPAAALSRGFRSFGLVQG